ncbi:DNA repair protein RecN (Recombination protein N) [Peptoniphilus koenoeneniae]|uniref:DNA repair protein RecN n=1 Tax=Peptoniphilus koenoeneniae TaxID=507751 RepID=A0ABU0ATS0_9FIRM|nr:DNA repair protein RecN [Peptoniphilus koenoeneniae]MDQ0274176.1 DNA repair protein RecN (Recombination protein N) [Peptoniphilus koenoeneniae]
MLIELKIENFAIIENLTIEWGSGLNILTGETGSGKSIIIDALGMVLGGRSNKDLIKTGAEYAYVEAVFSFYNEDLSKFLSENGFEIGELIVLSRQINRNKPSITRINGRVATQSVMTYISSKLVDVYAQEENQYLMSPKNQMDLIDDFCTIEHKKKQENLLNLFEEIKKYEEKKASLENFESSREREIDLLTYQIKEIEDANLTPYDDEDLENDFKKFSNSSLIRENLEATLNLLRGDYEVSAVEDGIDKAVSFFSNVKKFEPDLDEIYKELENIRFNISSVYKEIESYLENMDIDQEKFMYLEARIDTVNSLKKKYGYNIEEINKFKSEAELRLKELKNFEENLNNISQKIDELYKESSNLAQEISKDRKTVSKWLEENVEKEISKLNINNARFKINIYEKELSSTGIDRIEYMISTNIGEDFKPLSKIASGGEMSRIMLGFKSIIASKDNIPTVIFDEIDSGISGMTANIVGKKIKELSNDRQVIVISHLPQIVSKANSHYKIYKEINKNKTRTYVKKLKNSERVGEIARLIGSEEITDLTLKAAKEMIEGVEND